jgi:hypothetical protein
MAKQQEVVVQLKPMNVQRMNVEIEGTSPMIQHKWSEKALRQLREKGGGKKTKDRTARDPVDEAQAATYLRQDGTPGVPLLAIKSALISAAHKDIGVEKTLVRKGLFIIAEGGDAILKLEGSAPTIREDAVRVGMGATDLRYRPQFEEWRVNLPIEYDADLLQPSDIVNLIDRAGFGVGIGEWRPEKGGEFGRFRVRREKA